MTTKIMKCTCKHSFQDNRYGAGNRVFNQSVRDRAIKYRCTVCSAEVDGIYTPPEKEEKGSDA